MIGQIDTGQVLRSSRNRKVPGRWWGILPVTLELGDVNGSRALTRQTHRVMSMRLGEHPVNTDRVITRGLTVHLAWSKRESASPGFMVCCVEGISGKLLDE